MTSLPSCSIQSATPKHTVRGTGIQVPKEILLFGANLVDTAFAEAMEETRENSEKEVIATNGKRDEQKTEKQSDKEQATPIEEAESDKGLDQVDASNVGRAPVNFGTESESDQTTAKASTSTDEVPKIEIISADPSDNDDSSSDEDAVTKEKNEESDDRNEQDNSNADELHNKIGQLKRENKIKEGIKNLQKEKTELLRSLENERSKSQKFAKKLETMKKENELHGTERDPADLLRIQELEEENEHKENQLERAIEDMNKSLSSLHDQEEISSVLRREIEDLKSSAAQLQDVLNNKEEELNLTKERERRANQENSRLQASLSNAQTHREHHASMVQKLKSEITSLEEKNRRLLKESGQIEQKVAHEAQQKLHGRIQELEKKVIQVNEEKQKVKEDYDEAVKALEAVDKVYKVREATLGKYKTDYEDALDQLKEREREVTRLKADLSRNKEKLTRALEYKADREDLKDQIRKCKEAKITQIEETEQVRKDLEEERHQLKMAQARAQERGRKIQMLNLELTEVKDTLAIAKSVIDEKEKNMASVKESLDAEKHKNEKLEKELDILSHVQKKLEYIEDEKHLLECKLRNTEAELRETEKNLNNANLKRKEAEQNLENLEKEKKQLSHQLEEKASEIKNLRDAIDQRDEAIDEKLMEIFQANQCIEELRDELEDVLISYQNDREWWKQKADKVLGRRPKSAPPKRKPGGELAQSGTLGLTNRRLMKKMGPPRLNPSYINSQPKITWNRPQPTGEEQMPKLLTTETGDDSTSNSPPQAQPNGEKSTSPWQEVAPRPPSAPPSVRLRSNRPVSTYGVRTQPQDHCWSAVDSSRATMGYHSDGTDDDITAHCAVHKGDKVMVQSQITGEEKMNVTGLVKYVGKIGRQGGGSVFVGLKLDQPVGNTNGRFGDKQYFHCLPRHGKIVKPSDIHAVMNPRTRNYTRVRPMTMDY